MYSWLNVLSLPWATLIILLSIVLIDLRLNKKSLTFGEGFSEGFSKKHPQLSSNYHWRTSSNLVPLVGRTQFRYTAKLWCLPLEELRLVMLQKL
jgi:hypothetical protein